MYQTAKPYIILKCYKKISYFGQLFKCNAKPELWEKLKNEFNLQGQLHFICNQIIHSIPKCWEDALLANLENNKHLIFQGKHLVYQTSGFLSNLFYEKIE